MMADDPFNFRRLEEIERLGSDDCPGLLNEVVTLYRSAARSAIALMWNTVKQKNPAALRLTAHSLKGSSRQVGAVRLGDLCQQLEDAAEHQRLGRAQDIRAQDKRAQDIMIQIEAHFEHVEIILDTFCNKRNNGR